MNRYSECCTRHEKIVLVIQPLKASYPALIVVVLLLLALPAYALSGAKAAEQAGAVLFHDKDCAHCHGVGGVGGKKGPDLTGLRKDKNWPPAKIANQILNGGQKMPPFRDSLTDQEADQLVAWLRAKNRPTPPEPAK